MPLLSYRFISLLGRPLLQKGSAPFLFIPFTEAVAGAAGAAVATVSDIFTNLVVLRADSQPPSLGRAPAKII